MIGQPRCPSLLPSGRNCRGRNAGPPKRVPASGQTLCCSPLQLPKAGGPELLRRLEKRKKRGEDREQVLTAQQGAQPRSYLSLFTLHCFLAPLWWRAERVVENPSDGSLKLLTLLFVLKEP